MVQKGFYTGKYEQPKYTSLSCACSTTGNPLLSLLLLARLLGKWKYYYSPLYSKCILFSIFPRIRFFFCQTIPHHFSQVLSFEFLSKDYKRLSVVSFIKYENVPQYWKWRQNSTLAVCAKIMIKNELVLVFLGTDCGFLNFISTDVLTAWRFCLLAIGRLGRQPEENCFPF